MEKEFLRSQTAQIRVLHKASALRPVVVLYEVRQRAILEQERDALAFHVLLPDAGDDLRNVDVGTFRPCRHHLLDVVGRFQARLSARAGVISCLVQHLIHLRLERL